MFLRASLFTLIFSLSIFSISANESSHGENEEGFDFTVILVHHLIDHAEYPLNIGGGVKVYEGENGYDPTHHDTFVDHENGNKKFHFVGGFDMHITKRVLMMWLVVFFLFITLIPAARLIAKNPYKVHSRFTNSIETILEFLRKDVVDENMHHDGHPYYHYLFSLFFFILYCNLFGLIPPVGEIVSLLVGAGHHSIMAKVWNGITVTGDISVTATLAIITLVLIYGTGFVFQGPKFIINSVPSGVPLALYPLLLPLEFIISPLAKAFALSVRLLANMTAGHVIILALLGFIFQFQTIFVAPASIIGATAIYMLELFVAFLQAFLFTLLTTLFVSQSMHKH